MKNYKITVLRGDGIGPEIVNECIKVLDKAGEKFGFSFDYNDQLLGGCHRRALSGRNGGSLQSI